MPDLTEIRNQLNRSTLCVGVEAAHVNALAEIAISVTHPAGTVLFAEGDVAESLTVICAGRVGLDMHVPRRGKIRLQTLGSGDILGWSGVIGDGLMSATAVVLNDATLLNLPAGQLKKLCRSDHELGFAVMTQVAFALALRLRGTRLQLLDLFSETEPGQSESQEGCTE